MGNQKLQQDNPPLEKKPSKIIRIKEVTSRTGLSKSYIYALAKEGKFPKSIRLIKDGAAVGWLESSINDWISDCIANQEDA